jgi:hypothetical protein
LTAKAIANIRSIAFLKMMMNPAIAFSFITEILLLTTVAPSEVKSKYAPQGYIDPIAVISLQEKRGDATTAYKWWGVYRVDRNHPLIKAELQAVGERPHYDVGDAAVSVYAQQVEAKGIKPDPRLTGYLSYLITDEKGRVWQVIVRSDDDLHPLGSEEFSVIIANPGG